MKDSSKQTRSTLQKNKKVLSDKLNAFLDEVEQLQPDMSNAHEKIWVVAMYADMLRIREIASLGCKSMPILVHRNGDTICRGRMLTVANFCYTGDIEEMECKEWQLLRFDELNVLYPLSCLSLPIPELKELVRARTNLALSGIEPSNEKQMCLDIALDRCTCDNGWVKEGDSTVMCPCCGGFGIKHLPKAACLSNMASGLLRL